MNINKPLVSIIIPTFNRAHLIGETLDSVLAQTYQNWECIVVDDGSTDDTEGVMAEYMAKDLRFKYYHRPEDRPKGANACRNYGLKVSKGIYVNWFDSDDLMKPEFLARKLEVLEQQNVDFVISQSLNFDKKGTYEIKKYNGNSQFKLSGKNFILKKVYWMTPDFFIKRERVISYSFDESLQSGQETNFFIVLLNTSHLNGFAIEENLSFRRLHDSSIQQDLRRLQIGYQGRLFSRLTAYNQIYKIIDKEAKSFLQAEIMTVFYELKLNNEILKDALGFTTNLAINKNPFKAVAFFTSLIMKSYFNSGYNLFKFAKS